MPPEGLLMARLKGSKKTSVAARLVSLFFAVLVITALALMYFVGGELSLEGAKKVAAGFKRREVATEFYFEQGFDSVFATLGNNIVSAGDVGLQILGIDGVETHRDILRLSSPAISVSGKIAAVYDIGGTSLRIADADGARARVDAENAIVSCSVGSGGYVALTTREGHGYLSAVTVYGGRDYGEKYKWYSGEGYILASAMSGDNKTLAVLTVANGGSVIRFFNLDSTDERARCEFYDTLLLDIAFARDGSLVAIGRDGAYSVTLGGKSSLIYDFAGQTLRAYSLGGSGFVALFLKSAGGSRLVTADTGGAVLGDIPAEGDLLSLDAYGDRVAVLWADRLVGYDKRLGERSALDDTRGFTSVLLRGDGGALAIGSHTAELFEIN
jgi:hypothetical protein